MDRSDLVAAAQPERIAATVRAAGPGEPDDGGHGAGHGAGPGVSVRTATHNGHRIVVRTSYEIEVDGEPFTPHVVIDNDGRVHYHGLPTRDFESLVALVAKALDVFPEDFPAGPPDSGGTGHEHGHGRGHGEHEHGGQGDGGNGGHDDHDDHEH